MSKVARDVDISPNALRTWLRQSQVDAGQALPSALISDECAELTRSCREHRTLKTERDFLKKAATFIANEKDRHSS